MKVSASKSATSPSCKTLPIITPKKTEHKLTNRNESNLLHFTNNIDN